jgi:hypothetical protein
MAQARAADVYEQGVSGLPIAEQLELARIILNGIPPRSLVDYSEEWSEEDMREFSAASLARLCPSGGIAESVCEPLQ